MGKEKNLETCLVISTGFIALWYFFHSDIFIFISLVIGLIGLFFTKIANIITRIWTILSETLGFIVPKLALSFIFFMFLVPLGLLYKFFRKDTFYLSDKNSTFWVVRNYQYSSKDLKNTW